MFKTILFYPCSFLTNLNEHTYTTDDKRHKIPIINSMHDHHSILTRIRKEQMVLFNKRSFGLNTSQFIYNYFYEIMKKTDEECISMKTREEILDSLVNSEISLNELD